MRISTSMIYELGVDAITRNTSTLVRTQEQIASGRRILTASDDPVAAAQSLVTREAMAANARYKDGIAGAQDALAQQDTVLGQISDLLQEVRDTALAGGNDSLADADRRALANDIASRLEQLVGLANSRGGNGEYLFSGYQSKTMPFTSSGGVVTYNGDQGRPSVEVAPGRVLQMAANGHSLLMQTRTGNGTFAVSPAATNSGSLVVGGSTVADPSLITGHSYSIQFTAPGTFDVVDVTVGTTLSTGNTYVPGSAIAVDGMRVVLKGSPATGDAVALDPSAPQSIFETLRDLTTSLGLPGGTPAMAAARANGLTAAVSNIDQALEHILEARSDGGAKLRELDLLSAGMEDRDVQYQRTLSRLEDLDYSQALTRFAQQQAALEAAQKSFLKMSSLSLFDQL